MADGAGRSGAAGVGAPAVGRAGEARRRTRRSSRCASSTSSAGRPTRASSIRGSPRKALFDALDPLGPSVAWISAARPRWRAWRRCCAAGQQAGDPYDLVHFDGHGTFLPHSHIGALVFREARRRLAATRRPTSSRPNGSATCWRTIGSASSCWRRAAAARWGRSSPPSVAPRLIQAGVGSVLSMSHAVHVEAARLLLDRFYRELVRGTTIGHAVAQARERLDLHPGPLARIRSWSPDLHAGRLVPAPPLPARCG